MSFPITLTPSTPSGLDSPRLGDDELRALKQILADLFTLPVSPSTISATIGSVSTAGKFTLTNALWNGDVVGIAYGGTALSTIADAAILATNSANVLTAVVAGASQAVRRNAGNTAWEAFTPSAATVTSVAQSFTGGLISVAGSPITTSGTLALTVAGTSGGIPYFSGATTWASSGALTASALVLGGGAGAAPTPMGSLGTTTTLLHGNAAGAPTFGAVSLTADVSGITPTANGGTGIGDGANGQKFVQGYKTELTTINAAPTTQTTITIPANAILKAVLMRVTTVIPTAATMVVTATTTGTILQQGASIAVAAGTTDIGTRAWGTNYAGVADQTITITPNLTPANNTGRVRFDIYYEIPTVATS